MIYLIIGISVIIGLILLLKRSAKKSNTPENIITYFFQALEFEYFSENPNSEIESDTLDKSLLVASGFFYSIGKSIIVKLSSNEIVSIASYTINNQSKRANRIIYFIALYKLAQKFKEENKLISFKDGSIFIDEANNFNGIKIQETVNRHLKDGKAPVGHAVLTKNLIKRYPNWLQLEF